MATDGGRNTRQTQPLVAELDRLAARVGLGLSEIRITGHSKTDDRLIFDALGLTEVYSLIGFEAQAARARIEQLPWVRSAVIQRSIPNGLDIIIVERVPLAIWDYAGRRMLIDDTGRVLGPAPAAETALPVVGGAGADAAAAELLGLLGEHPRILGRMAIAQRIEGRRWTLVLDAGAVVHLPAEGEAEALWRLTMARSGGALADRGLAVIDLRAPAYVTIATGAASSVADLSGLAQTPGAVTMGRPIATRSQ